MSKIKKIKEAFSLRKIKKQIIDELQAKNQTNRNIAFSFALGVFLAFSPFWGLQTILAISLALFFRLNKVLVLIAVNISSIPPLIPLIIYMNFQFGSLIFNGKFLTQIPVITELSSLGENLSMFITGGILTGLATGIIAYYVVILGLKLKKRKQ